MSVDSQGEGIGIGNKNEQLLLPNSCRRTDNVEEGSSAMMYRPPEAEEELEAVGQRKEARGVATRAQPSQNRRGQRRRLVVPREVGWQRAGRLARCICHHPPQLVLGCLDECLAPRLPA